MPKVDSLHCRSKLRLVQKENPPKPDSSQQLWYSASSHVGNVKIPELWINDGHRSSSTTVLIWQSTKMPLSFDGLCPFMFTIAEKVSIHGQIDPLNWCTSNIDCRSFKVLSSNVMALSVSRLNPSLDYGCTTRRIEPNSCCYKLPRYIHTKSYISLVTKVSSFMILKGPGIACGEGSGTRYDAVPTKKHILPKPGVIILPTPTHYCWWLKSGVHQLIGSISHYLQGFIHSRWCRISSINSITNPNNTLLRGNSSNSPYICIVWLPMGN